jgi:carotenoid cleavage dioxygenase-like enzyme
VIIVDFPMTPDFSGLNEPVGKEVSLKALVIEGSIPAEIRGAFYRAVPDPAFPPKFADDNVLSGDGMISKLHFRDDGSVDFDLKFVQTARHKAEVAAGKSLFGRYRNPFTDDAEVAGVDRTVANTTPIWHAGKLLMAKEDGHAYRVDPDTLETLGSYDFDGALKSDTMTAHVRIDPITGEMFFYGYECDGLASTKVAYCIADKSGKLLREQWFDAPYCAMMHDFTITQNYALFPVYPTTADTDRLKSGGEHWVHELDRDSWVGVMPRYGDVSEMRWFKGPKGVSCYHMMNAHEDANGIIQFDQCLSSVNAFPFIQRASGLNIPPWEMKSALTRWTIDYTANDSAIIESLIGPPGDFPIIPATEQGRPYARGWMLSMNPEMQGPPVFGGPVGAMFNALLRIDLTGGPPQMLALPPAHCFNEPVHVPSDAAGHDGWLIVNVDQQTAENSFEHAAWIIEAGDVAAGPIAKIAIPARLRPQVHGWWVTAEQLAAA